MQEKYGFVYIWRDRKHKRYYIGSHWGHELDRYVCSSPWMKQAYTRRPQDFKRRILARVYTNKADLLEEEYRWMSFIKPTEIKTRYYNLHTNKIGHWTTNADTRTTRQKISDSVKASLQDPEVLERRRKAVANRDMSYMTPELIARRAATTRETCKERNSESMQREANRKRRYSPEWYEQQKELSNRRVNTPGWREKASERMSLQQKGIPKPHIRDSRWWTDGLNNKRSKESPGDGWVLGRSKIHGH